MIKWYSGKLSGAAARTGSLKRKGRKRLYIKEVRRFT